jgi:hypothetical protein
MVDEIIHDDRIGGRVAYGKTAGGALEELRTVDHVLQVSGAELATLQADIADVKAAVEALAAIIDGGKLKTDTELSIDGTGLATQTTLAALLAEILLRDVGSPVRLTGNGASQSIAVPVAAKAFACQAEGGDVRLEIGGAASATSTIRVPEDSWLTYPITGGAQTLSSYGAVGTFSNVRFLG